MKLDADVYHIDTLCKVCHTVALSQILTCPWIELCRHCFRYIPIGKSVAFMVSFVEDMEEASHIFMEKHTEFLPLSDLAVLECKMASIFRMLFNNHVLFSLPGSW